MACRSRPPEAGGSLTVEVHGRVGSSPDNAGTARNRQTGWVRQARREGVTTVNQRMNAPQDDSTSSNLTDTGWVAVRTRKCAGNSDSRLMSRAVAITCATFGETSTHDVLFVALNPASSEPVW